MKKPNILVLLPFLANGALLIKIIRSLRSDGFDVSVAFRVDASKTYPVDPLDDLLAFGKLIDLTKISQPECLPTLKSEIKKRGIDLVIQAGAFDLYHHLPYLKAEIVELKIVDIIYNEYGHSLNHFLYENCIDSVIVESNSMKQFIKNASEKFDPKVRVIYSGVDIDKYSPSPTIPFSQDLIIGYIGRMSDEKNPLAFVDLAETLLTLIPNISFRMFGTGAQEEMVKQRVNQSPQRSRLTCVGFIENVRDALHQLDVLVLPSKFDGRPNIVMEANACGIPVIAAPVGGVPDLVSNGINGFLVSPQNHSKIGELISRWKDFPDELFSIKKTSREYAIKNFDDKEMLANYAAAFVSIASTN